MSETDTKTPLRQADPLSSALLESRQRWREFGAIAADIAFETDTEGCLTFLSPETVLGWPAEDLLGRPAASLLLQGADGLPDPFRFMLAMQRRRAWMRQADGGEVCLSISTVPRLDPAGMWQGTRGIGVDVTNRERTDALAAAALRRGEVLDHILGQMRREVSAPRMMQCVLAELTRALGGDGAAVLDKTSATDTSPVRHQAGAPPDPVLPESLVLLARLDEAPEAELLPNGRQILACTTSTRFGDEMGLVVWREAGGRLWTAEDVMFVSSVAGIARIVLEHEAIQRELARQARTDPLTSLLNRRAFLEEAARRIDRLDREEQPGTLIFIDLDRLKPLNDRLGHEAGDAAITLAGALLRRTVRPSDLVARLGGDEFAMWLDGTDELTAAERAEALRLTFPKEVAHLAAGDELGMTMSIGIACRQPGTGEELDMLIQRADQVMYEVKRDGRGHWRVSHPERVA